MISLKVENVMYKPMLEITIHKSNFPDFKLVVY